MGKWLCMLVLLMSMASPANAVDIYVSPGGNDSDSGAELRPLKTISRALAMTRPGDTVILEPGIYRQSVQMDNSGTAEQPITLRARKEGTAILDATGFGWAMTLTGAAYVVIEGLEITGSGHTCLLLNHFHENPAKGTRHITVRRNYLHHCGTEGYSALLVGGHDSLIEQNRITHSGYDTTGKRGRDDHGLYLMGNRNHIRDNLISDNAHSGIRMEGDDNRIERNRILRNGRHGLTIWTDDVYSANNTLILNNEFEDQQDSVIRLNGEGSGKTPNGVHIEQNRIVQHIPVAAAIQASGGVRNITLLNNHIEGEYRLGTVAGITP